MDCSLPDSSAHGILQNTEVVSLLSSPGDLPNPGIKQVSYVLMSKYWSFSFNISPSNEYSGLISFRMDCLYLLEVQGTVKNLLQHHSSKATILQHSAFFIVLLSHPYMTTGKTIALTRWTFVGKVLGFKREDTLRKNESFISGLYYSFWHIFQCQQVVSE